MSRYKDAQLEMWADDDRTTSDVKAKASLARELLLARKVVEAAKAFMGEDSVLNFAELENALEDYEAGYGHT